MPDELASMPYSQDAEETVIGSALIDPESLRQLDLTAGEFYLRKNGIIFDHMRQVMARGETLDFVTVTEALKQSGKLDEVGGAAYLTRMITTSISSTGVDSYAAIVRERSRQRRVIIAARKLTTAGFTGADLDRVITEAMTELVQAAHVPGGAVHWSEYLSDLYDEIETRAKNPQDIFGISTGMCDLDAITGGFQLRESNILSGEPGLGKSLLALQWAEGMASPKIGKTPGAVYELEMNAIQTARRSVSRAAKVRTRKMRTGKLDDAEFPRIVEAIEGLSSYPIYMSDATDWTTLSLRADLARVKDRAGIRWFVVDYLELLKDVSGDDIERTKHISGQIKSICKDLNLCGITIQSMNKSGISGAVKGKASLAGSVKISYDADNIWILRKTDTAGEVRLDAEKLREGDGSGDFVDMVMLPGFPAFGQKARY